MRLAPPVLCLGLLACQVESKNDPAFLDPPPVTSDSSGQLPSYGSLQISLRGETRKTKIRIDNYVPTPSWRDELIGASDASGDALPAYLKKLTAALKERPEHAGRPDRPKIVSLDLADVSAKKVIEELQTRASIAVRTNLALNERISVSARNVPWQELVSHVADLLRVVAVRESSTEAYLADPDGYLQQLETRVYRVKHITGPTPPPPPAREVTSFGGFDHLTPSERKARVEYEDAMRRFVPLIILRAVLSQTPAGTELGKLDFDPETKSFIMQDTKQVLDRVKRILDVLDK